MTPTQRSRKWQVKMIKNALCPICAEPSARSCQQPKCSEFRVHVWDKKCWSCGKKTSLHRLCSTHLAQDRERKTAAR